MGHGRKKKRTHVAPEPEELSKTPRSLVVKSGHVGRTVSALASDVRQVMEPNTASKLKERRSNKIKDYVAVSSQLGISHFMLFSQSEAATNLRIGRVPHGPTLSFRVNKYSLAKDCIHLQKSPRTSGTEYRTSPLVILNNFTGEGKGKEFKLMTAVIQNMFPSINPSTMALTDARRVVLFNFNEETQMIDFRHYVISVKPLGVTKGVKRAITSKKLPDLAKFSDISEYVLRESFASESDVEDGPENSVTLAQDYVGRGNRKNEQRAIRLIELGPRMELKLLKVQAGLCDGEILYHGYKNMTKEEIEKQARLRQIRLTQQARRRKQQQDNVDRKKKDSKGKNTEDNGSDDESSSSESGKATNRVSNSKKQEDDFEVAPAEDDFGADGYNSDDLFDEVGISDGQADSNADDSSDDSEEETHQPTKKLKKSKRSAPKKKRSSSKRTK